MPPERPIMDAYARTGRDRVPCKRGDMRMKHLIVGGVAAGTKAAAKIKRCDRTADVLVISKSHDISYAGCGLPYYVGGDIETREELIVNTPAKDDKTVPDANSTRTFKPQSAPAKIPKYGKACQKSYGRFSR